MSALAVPVAAADKSECKDGGWKTLSTAGGDSFKSQGQCVAYVIHGGTFEQPEVLFAVAYSDLDGNHVFSGADQVISKVVDNGNGSLGPGDLIEMHKYPTSVTPTAADFAGWGIRYHTVQSVERSTTSILVATKTGGTFGWHRELDFDGFYESGLGGTSMVLDTWTGVQSDAIAMETGSPSRPASALHLQALNYTDDGVVDVELFQ